MFQGTRISLAALSALCIFLAGCAMTTPSTTVSQPGIALTGSVHGGQQPVVGSHVHLFAAGTSGYGGASTSLLTNGLSGTDSLGGYVLSDATGSFSVTGDYGNCTTDGPVYVLATQGNPGLPGNANNPNLALMTVLGQCPVGGAFASTTFVNVTEVTTVASVYALSGFMTDLAHVSTNTTTLGMLGMSNAFATVNSLVNTTTGAALVTTPPGNGNVPQQEINTLANILASCNNTTGAGSSSCTTLFGNALNGTTRPTDTTTAALNIAHTPGVNVSNLFGLQPAAGAPFQPALSYAPPDFSVAIYYSGGTIQNPNGVAIDGSGNVWLSDLSDGVVSELNGATGAPISTTGYSTGVTGFAQELAIDSLGNVWVTPHTPQAAIAAGNGIFKISPTGTVTGPFTGGGLANTTGIAIGFENSVWVTNLGPTAPSLTELSNLGSPLSGSSGDTGGGIFTPFAVAVDNYDNVWTVDYDTVGPSTTSGLTEFNYLGVPQSPAGGYLLTGSKHLAGISIDFSSNLWLPSTTGFVEANSSGTELSPAGGYTGTGCCGDSFYGLAIDGAGNVWGGSGGDGFAPGIAEVSNAGAVLSPNQNYSVGYFGGAIDTPAQLAIDPSGNLWEADLGNGIMGVPSTVTEFIGLATPVLTPVTPGQLGIRPQHLF